MEQYYNTSISNKEALKDKIHEIHNYMRNHGIGYGMNALKTFNVLYGLKKIEDGGLIDACGLERPYCEFSYMVKLANESKDEELTECILKYALDSIATSSLSHLLFYEIPRNVRASVFSWLVKEIDQVGVIEKTCNVLLSGKIYEYFIGRDETAISELGAYFTDRHIVDFILNRVRPSIKEDGTIHPMIDMFGGSGGFTTGYVQYLQQKYPGQIDWKKETDKVFHYDMNEDVVKSARLELFCLTGAIPSDQSLRYKNSFDDEFDEEKFHYILTNPPYGGDKQEITEAQMKQQKIKDYIKNELSTLTDDAVRVRRQKQLKVLEEQEKHYKKQQDKLKVSRRTCSNRINRFIIQNKISKANDKESCSLILMMELLAVGGTAVGVLKEGVFFNKTYKDIRRCLVEKFNVREIISVPSDQFENTSTKTTIVIFDNTEEKTSKVKFSDLVVERYTEDKFAEFEGDVYLVENKGDIKGVSDKMTCEATRDQILANELCSLNPKEYLKKEIKIGEGYEMKRLGDLSDICMGATPDTKEHKYWENGNIPWVTVSDLNNNVVMNTKRCLTEKGTNKMKNRKIPKNSILLSFKLSIGKLGIAGRDDMYCNEAIVYLNSKEKHIPQMYLYYILDLLDLEKYGRGTIGKHGNLNKDILTRLQIPIPKSSEKLQEWVEKISKPYFEKIEKEKQIKELAEQVQKRIREITEKEECEKVRLGDIANIWCGKSLSKENAICGKYNVFGGGKSSYTHNEYNLEGFNIIISRVGNNNITLVNEQLYLTDNGFSVILRNSDIKEYVGYYLLVNEKHIINFGNGSAQKVIAKSQLSKFSVMIPKNKQLIQDMKPLFQQIETLQNEVKIAGKQYKQYIQELSEEAMPSSF